MEEEEVQSLYKNGIEAYRRGELNRAVDSLMQVVDAKEDDHRAWNALGVVLTKTKKYDDADVCFENALSLDPSNEVYERNRTKNKKFIKKGLADYLSKDSFALPLPVKPLYLAGGIAMILILAVVIFGIIPFLFPAPVSSTVGEIPITIELLDDVALIKNTGGPDSDKVSYFSLTGNNQTILSADKRERILGTDTGSTLAIPFEELRGFATENIITFRITAFFSDGTNKQVKTETVTLPPVPAVETVVPTPTPVQYTAQFKSGDIVLDSKNGSYSLIFTTLPDHQYLVNSLSRRNDGLFIMQEDNRNISQMDFDAMVVSTGLSFPQKIPEPGIPLQAHRSSSLSGTRAYPLYIPGDIVSQGSGSVNEAVVILGYDSGTNEYATDTLIKYNSGEWGYRSDAITEWTLQNEIEQRYPSRINRVALSLIGIGSDSSPPGTAPKYGEGDIVAKDRGAEPDQVIILAYEKNSSMYNTDVIYRSYGGNWERTGVNLPVIRSVLEQDYPYKVRNVDVSQVTVNKR